MYKNIVVLLDHQANNSNTIDTAVSIAKSNNGCVIGVYVLPLTSTMISMPDVVDVESFRRKSNEVHEKFETAITAAGIKGTWCYKEASDMAVETTRQGLYADLIILERNNNENAIADRVILSASCPTLILPPSGNSSEKFDRVIIAWKSTREAARTLRDALPILHKANHIKIVSFEEPNNSEKNALTSYLTTHGINAKIDQLTSHDYPIGHGLILDIDTSIGEKILTQSKDDKSTLIVMGAYGHSRLSEIIFSGVTHYVTRNAEIPILMSH